MTVSAKHFMRRVKNIHFIGIGGVGMSGIAEVDVLSSILS